MRPFSPQLNQALAQQNMTTFSILIITFLISIPIMLGTFFLHISLYKKVLSSLKNREFDVKGLEVEFFDYGSRGVIRKIKRIYTKIGRENINTKEDNLLRKSKFLYYWPTAIGLLIFISAIISLFIRI